MSESLVDAGELIVRPDGERVLCIQKKPEDWGDRGKVALRRDGVAILLDGKAVAVLDEMGETDVNALARRGQAAVILVDESDPLPALNECAVVDLRNAE